MNILLFCLSVHQLIDIWFVFNFYATTHKAAFNVYVQVFEWTYVLVLWSTNLGMELLGHVVSVCLYHLGTVKLLPHFTLRPAMQENSNFSASLTALVTVGLFLL